jgi:hypothetical protein
LGVAPPPAGGGGPPFSDKVPRAHEATLK